MRILYLGQLLPGQTALMRKRALERLGHVVCGVNTIEPWKRAPWIKRQIQKRTRRGSVVDDINSSIVSAAREFKPEIVWADKQEFLRADTAEMLHKIGALLVHFTPDPYFTLAWKRTPIMDETMRHFDVLIYCKAYEKVEYEALGRRTVYMPLGYCDETHRPLISSDPRWNCDVGFIGGWEPRRERMLRSVAETDSHLKFRGAYWDFLHDGRWTLRRYMIMRELTAGEPVHIHKDDVLACAHEGDEVYGDDYARALTGAKIGLGFLRKAWPDQHTTRSFEIPACRSMLLADRTEEHQSLFEEGKEAEFFGSTEELLEKLRFYSGNESARKGVAELGHRRCISSRYAYVHLLGTAVKALKLESPRKNKS